MRSELQRDEIFQVLGEFHKLGMRIANLDGGEALLHRNIDEIVDIKLVQREKSRPPYRTPTEYSFRINWTRFANSRA